MYVAKSVNLLFITVVLISCSNNNKKKLKLCCDTEMFLSHVFKCLLKLIFVKQQHLFAAVTAAAVSRSTAGLGHLGIYYICWETCLSD